MDVGVAVIKRLSTASLVFILFPAGIVPKQEAENSVRDATWTNRNACPLQWNSERGAFP